MYDRSKPLKMKESEIAISIPCWFFVRMVGYPQPGGSVKLASRGRIETVGLEGATRGRAGICEQRAQVLVSRGDATGAEVFVFAREVDEGRKVKRNSRLMRRNPRD